MTRGSDARPEAGASLVLVLVALTVFGLLVPVLGQFGSANGVSGFVVKGQRFDRYAADNGVQGAIAKAQTDRTMGREYVPCPEVTSTMNAGSASFRRDVTVRCRGFAGSGIPVYRPVDRPDAPAYAVLGLDPGEHSIDIDSRGTVKTAGAWWANGDPSETSAHIRGGIIDARTDLFGATGGCRQSGGAAIYAAPRRCDTGETVAPPDLGTSLANLDGLRADTPAETRDACATIASGNGVVPLASGIHWDRDWLNQLTDGSCGRDVVVVLQPGPHYFDFDFYDDPGDRSPDNRWQIGGSGSQRVTLVGGTPINWADPAGAYAAAGHPNAAAAPGACDLGSPGVEIVLGSRSNITIESPARAELCPLAVTAGGQRISISGPTAGEAGPSQEVGPSEPTTARADAGGDPFSWPASPPEPIDPLLNQDCNSRDTCPPTLYREGELRRRRGQTTITMEVPNPFRENARVDELEIDVSHRESENRDDDDDDDDENNRNRINRLYFTVTGLAAPVRCEDFPKNDRWTQRTVRCDVRDLTFPMPDPAAVPTLGVVMHIETNNGNRGSVTVGLDHVALHGSETTAQVRAQACDCEAFFVDNDGRGNSAAAFVWGTVVLPTADVRAHFGGSSTFRLARGVIARQFRLEGVPTNDPNFIPVSLPGGGTYSGRIVEFEAQIAGRPKLRARVRLPDPVAEPTQAPVILAWDTHP